MLILNRIAAIALLAAASLVQGQYNLVSQDLQNAGQANSQLASVCNNYQGACTGFFQINDLWYKLASFVQAAITDTGTSPVFTNSEAAALANLCNNNNAPPLRAWAACIANKRSLFINIGAKITVCEQAKRIQDLYTVLVNALVANNPGSPSVPNFQQCKNLIDQFLNSARAQYPAPCP